MSTEPVETFVFLPFSKYKALDNRAKMATEKSGGVKEPSPPSPSSPIPSANPSSDQEELTSKTANNLSVSQKGAENYLGKDLTKNYRSVQLKKLLHHIKKAYNAENIASLTNLDDLINAALTNKRKKLPNEEVFFTFLFENGLGHFVKNRSKIDLYYKGDPWYQL